MLRKTFLKIILLYRKVSVLARPLTRSLLGTDRACRFEPTCAEYMYQSVNKYGIFKGSFLGLKRLFRCHPAHPGGYDPLRN